MRLRQRIEWWIMSSWTDAPEYKINAFIANELFTRSIIPAQNRYVTELSDAGTITLPLITPVQQGSEITSAYDTSLISETEEGFIDLPFINYTVTLEPRTMNYISCGQLTYTIYTHDIEKLREIAGFVIDLMDRRDWAATDLNDYLVADITNNFWFQNLFVASAVGPMESDSDGGRHGFMIVIGFDYTYHAALSNDTTKGPLSNYQDMR